MAARAGAQMQLASSLAWSLLYEASVHVWGGLKSDLFCLWEGGELQPWGFLI